MNMADNENVSLSNDQSVTVMHINSFILYISTAFLITRSCQHVRVSIYTWYIKLATRVPDDFRLARQWVPPPKKTKTKNK